MWIQEAAIGFGLTVEVTKHLCHRVSPFQTIDIYETVKTGRMMLLDGVIQLSEWDEFSYQEMMTHVPLMAHPCPENVLVIGGGDGGVLREVARHACVRRIDQCEIDAEVIACAKEFLPSMACGYDDPRVHTFIGDGAEFIRNREGEYDVIIVDSTDPAGPGEPLFGEAFYQSMKRALRPGGVIASQSESVYLLSDIVRRLLKIAGNVFRFYGYGAIMVPTYPTGMIGVCCASDARDIREPVRVPDGKLAAELRYYTPEIHRACFTVPKFALNMTKGLPDDAAGKK